MKTFLIAFAALLTGLTAFSQDKPEGLFINSKAPDFKGTDQNGKEISLKELRKKGDVILVFYRGYWCPYCNRYMKRLQDSLSLIEEANASLVVITSQREEFMDTTVSKTGASFSIIHDKDMKIAQGYKVAYRVEDRQLTRYKNSNPSIDLLAINGQKKEAYLPVPAVYVVNTDGDISFRYFEDDYKKRVPVEKILNALKGNR